MPKNSRWSMANRVTPDRHAAWDRVMRAQHGVVGWDQFSSLQVTRGEVRANVRAGRWRRVLPRVYATFTGELSREARIAAALLYGGPRAALSHHTAAEEWGVIPIKPDRPIEITVPYTHSAVSQPTLVRVHRSRAMPFIVVGAEWPRTTSAATIVDLATAEPTEQHAVNRLVELAGRMNVNRAAVANCLDHRRPYRYERALKSAALAIEAGVMSVLELEYQREVEEAHGIPAAQRQVPFRVDGRVLYEDATYDHLGVPLTVRLDGRAYHHTPGVAFRDRRRDNAAELAGRHRLVYGWHEVHHDPCGVAAEVAAVLARNGWTGTTRPCSHVAVSRAA